MYTNDIFTRLHTIYMNICTHVLNTYKIYTNESIARTAAAAAAALHDRANAHKTRDRVLAPPPHVYCTYISNVCVLWPCVHGARSSVNAFVYCISLSSSSYRPRLLALLLGARTVDAYAQTTTNTERVHGELSLVRTARIIYFPIYNVQRVV